ncbi:VENN motif pre-toxin domain-containing protein [Pantoea sp. C2G6]|uniref:VENN motif pre-toxin domain-containing protein n=1 Tax=Pantoea sp. C2G6 TaxID=3243084 RepID=UPI003ED8B7F8
MSGGAIPTSANAHGSASGTTRSAVADGAITVRNTQSQTQNVAALSRDTDNANGHIDKIFDKDKVARKLEFAQEVQELGQRVASDVSSYKMQAAEAETKERLLKANPQYASYSPEVFNNLVVNDAGYKAVAEKWGTGGSYSMAAAAVTGVLGGLGAGNFGAAAAGGMAPYIASKIKQETSTVVDGQVKTNVLANTMAHAVAGAVLAQLAGNSASAGAAGAAGGELMARAILRTMYPGKQASELTEDEKQVVSALGQLAAQLSAGVASGSVEGGIQGAVAGKNAVENNALSDIAQAQSEGKTLEQKAGEYVEAENERYKKENCGGMSAEACSVKMYTERREALKETVSLGADFVPVVGDIKSFAEAQSALDYLAAAIGIIPGAGDAAGKVIRAAETALKKGDIAEASKLINKASDEISGHLPGPGQTSLPSSGIGSNAAFSVNNAQLGKKLGKHVEDFGGNASNAADRQHVLDIINDIGSHPDKVIAGKFAGQGTGVGASRGDVFFRIKGSDVIVTKPDGSFVTILKDGINNTSVKNTLKGEPK